MIQQTKIDQGARRTRNTQGKRRFDTTSANMTQHWRGSHVDMEKDGKHDIAQSCKTVTEGHSEDIWRTRFLSGIHRTQKAVRVERLVVVYWRSGSSLES